MIVQTKILKEFETEFELRDGTKVFVRPLKPEDKDKLFQMYSTLSKDTNYFRFLKRKPITRWLVEKWIDIDYKNRMALIAIIEENGDQKIIADARYYVDKDTGEAEVAMVVHDHWQNKGLGTKLLEYTGQVAQKMGVKALHAYLSPVNGRIIHITRKLGYKAKWASDIIEYQVHLDLNKNKEKEEK